MSSGPPEPSFVKAKKDPFWKALGIYPKALRDKATPQKLLAEIQTYLVGLGNGNLCLLCQRGSLTKRTDLVPSQLASAIAGASDVATLHHLRELMKRRTEDLEQVFSATFSGKQRQAFLNNVHELGSPNEILKPYTKILLLFRQAPSKVRDVFYSHLWRSRSTYFEYDVEVNNGNSFAAEFRSDAKNLATSFGNVTRKGVKFSGMYALPNNVHVALFLREYGTRVRRDFRDGYNVLHDCGLIVVGYDDEQNRLHLKSGNRQFARALEAFCESKIGVKPNLLKNEVFSDYEQEQVRRSLLGHYKEQTGIEIVEVSFSKSGLPGKGSISLKAGFMETSLRKDLSHLDEDLSLLNVRGPGDFDSLTVSYGGKTAQITTEVVKGGAIRLKFQNAGWPAVLQRAFEDTFLETFGIPVNRLIDPSVVSLGKVGIYAYLLGIRSEPDVEGYQEECYGFLLENDYLVRHELPVKRCEENLCSERHKLITDQTQELCRKCENPLEETTFAEVSRNVPKMARLVAKVLERATPWKMGRKPHKYEGREYYPLKIDRPGAEDNTLCVVFKDRITKEMRTAFERLSCPLIVVQPHTDMRKVFVDEENTGRVSFAYLLAAQYHTEDKDACDTLCRNMTENLLRTYKERVQKAARHSYGILKNERHSLTGPKYEREIFNLLRAVFPFCHMLGRSGKPEPDGLVCIPDYSDPSEGLAKLNSWNFIYDAKYSEKDDGYDLDIAERRKMADYIKKFRKNKKVLDGKDRKVRAHVIISNQVTNQKMKNAADYLFGNDGLPKRDKEVRLVLMREEFLTGLFEWMQSHTADVQDKRGYLLELLINLMQSDGDEGFLELAGEEAQKLVENLKGYRVIEQRIPAKELEDSLDGK